MGDGSCAASFMSDDRTGEGQASWLAVKRCGGGERHWGLRARQHTTCVAGACEHMLDVAQTSAAHMHTHTSHRTQDKTCLAAPDLILN